MYAKELKWKDMCRINFAQNRDYWRALVNMINDYFGIKALGRFLD